MIEGLSPVQDIRALFYEWFLDRVEPESQPSARGGSVSGPAVPDTFQLRQNYRTHMGVVRLAHSVVSTAWFYVHNTVSQHLSLCKDVTIRRCMHMFALQKPANFLFPNTAE